MSRLLRNIGLKIAYDGTEYSGWQVQENAATIQGIIEDALKKMHKQDVKLTGAGRTDAGVHARGQTANFKTDISSITEEKFMPALNSLLPRDIRVLKSYPVPMDFNSRYDAVKRVYRYFISDKPDLYPWQAAYSLFYNRKLDICRLNELAAPIEGIHDFTSFSAPMENCGSKVREIFSSVFYYRYPYTVYEISGSGFLRKMVRTIAGTILEAYTNGCGREDMEKILNARDRSRAGATASPKGLFLEEVIYNETDY